MAPAPYAYRSDKTVPGFPDDRPVIVFDAECVLCSGWIKFALWADRRKTYRFLSAQSDIGKALYRHYGLDDRDYETNILIRNGKAYFKSGGSIRMIAGLGFPWSMVTLAYAIPGPIRDVLYELVARNRYRLFGKRDTCLYPSAEVRERFIGHEV